MLRGFVYDRLRILSPYPVRRWLKSRRWFSPVAQRLFGSNVYSRSYFEDIERIEGESVKVTADWIVKHLVPGRVIDVGCGPGHQLAALRERGIDQVFGVDISEEALRSSARKGLAVERFDLTEPGRDMPGIPYDLAISCEVAEHLEERYADCFLDKLVAAASLIYFTAAEPIATNGVGLLHVNEQPHSYWIEKMRTRGFAVDDAATTSARAHCENRVIDYLSRPLIFVRSNVAPANSASV